jgi:hypothetical protein
MKPVFTINTSLLRAVPIYDDLVGIALTSKLYHAKHRKINAIMPTFQRIKRHLVSISIVLVGIDVVLIAVNRIPQRILNMPRVTLEYVTTTLIAAVSLCITVAVATILAEPPLQLSSKKIAAIVIYVALVVATLVFVLWPHHPITS